MKLHKIKLRLLRFQMEIEWIEAGRPLFFSSHSQTKTIVNSSDVMLQQKNRIVPHIAVVTWWNCEQHDEDDKLSLNHNIQWWIHESDAWRFLPSHHLVRKQRRRAVGCVIVCFCFFLAEFLKKISSSCCQSVGGLLHSQVVCVSALSHLVDGKS